MHIIWSRVIPQIAANFTDVLVSVAGLFAQHDGFWNKEWTLFIQWANAHFPAAT